MRSWAARTASCLAEPRAWAGQCLCSTSPRAALCHFGLQGQEPQLRRSWLEPAAKISSPPGARVLESPYRPADWQPPSPTAEDGAWEHLRLSRAATRHVPPEWSESGGGLH